MGMLTIHQQSIKVHSCDKLFQSLTHFSYGLNLVSATQHIQHMWQSQIEIEYYSVAYFERIAEFDAL